MTSQLINAGNSRKTVALEVRILLAVVAVMIVKQVASVLSTLWGYIFVTLALGYIGAIPFSAFYTSYIEDNWSAAFSAWTHLLVWIAAFNAVATLHRLDHAHSNGVGDKPPMNPMIRWVVATIESKGKNATPLYVGFVAIWPFLCFYFMFFVVQVYTERPFFIPRPTTFGQFLFAIVDINASTKLGEFLKGTELNNYIFTFDQARLLNKITVLVGQLMIAYLVVRRVLSFFKPAK